MHFYLLLNSHPDSVVKVGFIIAVIIRQTEKINFVGVVDVEITAYLTEIVGCLIVKTHYRGLV